LVRLADINTRIMFATPSRLRDGQLLRGTVLCRVVGDDLLDLYTTQMVNSRLRPHDCPAMHVNMAQFPWAHR
jgi:hypothetical protein